MSFYRKYRPSIIEEIDNLAVKERLHDLLAKKIEDLPHAYLLTGPKGTGKTTAARIIAKLFVCTKKTKHGPCGVCQQCDSVAKGKNLDVYEIDAASNRGIDEIRQLKQAIALSPAVAAFKVYIIDEVHMLTTDAFNALLKTLEEPPTHAVFVLATTDPQKVLPTIRSRCVELTFHKAGSDELKSALMRIIEHEHISIDDDAVMRIIELSDGAFRDGVKMLEQMSLKSEKITRKIIDSTLNVPSILRRQDFFRALKNKNISDALSIVGALSDEGMDIRTFVVDCSQDAHQLLVDYYLKTTDTSGKENAFTSDEILLLSDIFIRCFARLRNSPIPQLPLELAILEFCQTDNSSQHNQQKKPTEAVQHKIPEKKIISTPASTKPVIDQILPSDKVKNIQETSLSTESKNIPLDKLKEHWTDVIEAMKPFNNSVSGVLRSARPVASGNGMVTIEAFYSFHKERLSDPRVRDTLSNVMKRLFGAQTGIEIILGKK